MAKLYAAEKDGRGRPPEERVRLRQARAKPILDDLEAWLQAQLPRISGKSELAEAIRYALARLGKLRPYLAHGCLEADTDAIDKRFVRREPHRARVTARRRAGRGVEVPPRSLTTVAPLSRRPCALPAAAAARP